MRVYVTGQEIIRIATLCAKVLTFLLLSVPQAAVGQWATGSAGSINYTGGNVGIGTASPQQKLEVSGNLGLGIGVATPNALVKSFGTAHQLSNTPASIGLILSDGWESGVVVKNMRDTNNFNSQAIDFVTHHGGVSGGTRMTITQDGTVGIGTTTPAPQYKLVVNGSIAALDIVVTNTLSADYVFHSDYRLPPLTEIDRFIRTNGHLPEIPSEADVKKTGMSVADMQTKLLAKIKELTLHLIQQDKETRELRKRLAQIEQRAKPIN